MARDADWSDTELRACVDAYLVMLQMEAEGRSFVKSRINKELRDGALGKRTKGSVEFRMRNISTVMRELGLSWVIGYLPALNVGENVKAGIRQIILERKDVVKEVTKPTPNLDEYQRRSSAIRVSKPINTPEGKPEGQSKPATNTTASTSYYRDPQVRAWVLNESHGNCEACGNAAPFLSDDNSPFLETHHMKRLADDGPDVVENAVAICPNCHRRLHYSSDRQAFSQIVYERVSRLRQY